MLKEAAHELGHALGLKHCKNRFCVMHFSNNLKDTDIKTSWFCNDCEREISFFLNNPNLKTSGE